MAGQFCAMKAIPVLHRVSVDEMGWGLQAVQLEVSFWLFSAHQRIAFF